LQSKSRQFWDVGFSDWYAAMQLDHPRDIEKVCKPAYLHAERWRNEHTSEELWALVALQEGWRVPEEAIEEAVWRRVTFGPRTAEENESDAPPEEEGPFEFGRSGPTMLPVTGRWGVQIGILGRCRGLGRNTTSSME
jgi:hypothetical protein